MTLNVTCRVCNRRHKVQVKDEEYASWINGSLIQDVMPGLSAAWRELLISGTCSTCFDLMFAEEP